MWYYSNIEIYKLNCFVERCYLPNCVCLLVFVCLDMYVPIIYIYICPHDDLKLGKNEIIKLNTSVNEPGSSTEIQCCCGRSFASIKGMRIHRTKMGCLSQQRCKSQSEINKSIDGNQSQENYHSTQDHFVCQPNAPSVKGNAIPINWPKANYDGWKVLDEEVSFILWSSLRGSIRVKLHSFTTTIHAVYLEHFGAEDVQKGKNIRTVYRRQREKGWFRVEQKLL